MNKVYVLVKWWKNEVKEVKLFKTYNEAWDYAFTDKNTFYCQIFDRVLP